jgi:uncharacterized protein YgiM (DUF1202 family)
MNRLRSLFIGLFTGLLLTGASIAALAQDAQVVTNRATDVRAMPDETASVVQSLRAETPVQVLQRRGRWNQIKVGNSTGWVLMFHLRGGATVVEADRTTGGGFFAGFNRLLSGDGNRGNQRAQSATLGIRGFSKEDVARAELNPAELERLKRFQATPADAQNLARQGRLAFRSVAYLSQDAIVAANSQGARK